jgi:hypothetical protein
MSNKQDQPFPGLSLSRLQRETLALPSPRSSESAARDETSALPHAKFRLN